MTRSLTLATYLTLAGPGTLAQAAPEPPRRPHGPLVWFDCPNRVSLAAVGALVSTLVHDGDPGTYLATSPWLDASTEGDLWCWPTPGGSRSAIKSFLDHWRPDLLVCVQGPVDPVLAAMADRRGISRVLIDVAATAPLLARGGWMPGLTRVILSGFAKVHASDEAAATRLRKRGVPPGAVHVVGALDEGIGALPCDEAERQSFAEAFRTRPVWLAAGATPQEQPLIAQAHAQVSRRAHRLMLIYHPADPSHAEAAVAAFREAGFLVAVGARGEVPGEQHQVLVVDPFTGPGLWYRLATVCFMGGTLSSGTGRNPLEAAGLGAALVHGSQTDPHTAQYQRLARAGAARVVRNSAELAEALDALLSPDKAALLAHAAWDVASSGAEAANLAIELIREHLDRVGG